MQNKPPTHHSSSGAGELSGIALGYVLDGQGSGLRVLADVGKISPPRRVQTGSEAHPASYQ